MLGMHSFTKTFLTHDYRKDIEPDMMMMVFKPESLI